MKYQIMLGILFTLLARRKISAGELAAKYDVSVRTIYRYVDEMTIAGVPIDIARGQSGGIYISDAFKLPKGMMTKEEYGRTVDALLAMNAQLSDPVLASAIQKITAQMKAEKFGSSLSGNILVDSGSWGDEQRFSEKLSLMENAIETREVLEIDYYSREREHTQRKIYPHLLVLKQNLWYVYAYCTVRRAFRLFKLGRMRVIMKTGETFERIPFSRDDVPLSFWHDGESMVSARFEILPESITYAEEWLGIENVTRQGDRYIAEVTLHDDESLVKTILAAGGGFRVLSPLSLAERVQAEARRILRSYD